jgi:integrase
MYETAKRDSYENALVRVFYYAMQRISSTIALDISDIDFDADIKTITFRIMKRGEKPHIVAPDEATLQAIKDYIGTRKEGALFLNKIKPTRLNEGQCRIHIKQLAVDSGINKNVTPHFFRRSNITHKKINQV